MATTGYLMAKEVITMMYKLLCDYATVFGVDFPISAIKDSANEYEAVGIMWMKIKIILIK